MLLDLVGDGAAEAGVVAGRRREGRTFCLYGHLPELLMGAEQP